jgi:hypothetical protein
MKRSVFVTLCLGILLFASCEDELDKNVEFKAEVRSSEYITIDAGGVIYAPAGTNIDFDFSGDPDFISFSYNLFKQTTPTLKFTSVLSWNNDTNNTLQLYISGSFAGLNKTDARADSIAIAAHQWVNISPQCAFPATRNGSANSVVLLEEYRGRTIVLAFRYKTVNNTGMQPMWTINNLLVSNTFVGSGEETSVVEAATMGLTPFDMFNLTDPYQMTTSAGGIWDISTPASLKIRQTQAKRDLNEDWLLSKPFEISSGVVVKGLGTPVKDISNNVNSFSHTFKERGEYTVTFTATNYNFKHHSEVQKTFRMVIE